LLNATSNTFGLSAFKIIPAPQIASGKFPEKKKRRSLSRQGIFLKPKRLKVVKAGVFNKAKAKAFEGLRSKLRNLRDPQ